MAVTKVIYKEPASYFNDDMKKAIKDYKKKEAEKAKEDKKPAKKGK